MAPAFLIRRFGVRVTLLAGAGVMATGFASLALMHGLVLYFLGAALCGVGFQMMALIPATFVLGALYPRRGLPFGIYFTAGSLGGVAGPAMVWLITGPMHADWRDYWAIQIAAAAALGVLAAVMVGGPDWLARAAERTDALLAEEAAAPRRGPAFRTAHDWTVRQALATPQFFILLAAYFGHLLVGVTVASLAVAHLSQRGVAVSVALGMLSLESLVQTLGRAGAASLGERIDPRHLLLVALFTLTIGAGALSIAGTWPLMLIFAVASGLGYGLTALAVTMLLLDYFGRKHNLEIFSLTCLVGAVSALGPTFGGQMRDLTGAFSSTFQILAAVAAVIFLAVLVMRPPQLTTPPLPASEDGV